jgi:hypothetical protein
MRADGDQMRAAAHREGREMGQTSRRMDVKMQRLPGEIKDEVEMRAALITLLFLPMPRCFFLSPIDFNSVHFTLGSEVAAGMQT